MIFLPQTLKSLILKVLKLPRSHILAMLSCNNVLAIHYPVTHTIIKWTIAKYQSMSYTFIHLYKTLPPFCNKTNSSFNCEGHTPVSPLIINKFSRRLWRISNARSMSVKWLLVIFADKRIISVSWLLHMNLQFTAGQTMLNCLFFFSLCSHSF